MSAQVFSFTASSTIRPLAGCLTTGGPLPVPPTSGPRVTAMLPMLVDFDASGGRFQADWLEFVLSSNSETPTGGLALRIGNAVFYLLFNLMDLCTREMLALAHREGCLHLLFKNAQVPLNASLMCEAMTAFRQATREDSFPREWFDHALGLVPGLPAMCASAQTAFHGAKTHHAVLLGQADALLALRAGPVKSH
jgi:hypothetical protein